MMADLPGYLRNCLHTGKLALLAILVSGGIVLQILACALYNNWWPMLTVHVPGHLPQKQMLIIQDMNYACRNVSSPQFFVLMFMSEFEVCDCVNNVCAPLLFFAGSDGSSFLSESDNSWVNATKFLTGASAVGSIAIPAILKHAGVIGWGALAMELSSYFIFVLAIMCCIQMNNDDDYSFL
ncbi:hypothetical protein CRYUN_Cryun12cG0018400 [Craigia yunnanensis]